MRSTTGHIEPTIYFRYPNGYVVLAPYSGCPTPPGADREAADTLPDVEKLEKRLVDQERIRVERELEGQWNREGPWLEASIKASLYRIQQDSNLSDHEKEAIKLWFMAKDEERRQRCLAELHIAQSMRLEALHYNTPKGRRVDSEEYDKQRVDERAERL